MQELLATGAAALKKAALNEEAKNHVLKDPVLFHILKKAADRYIGGETLDETIPKVTAQNGKGHKCSIEFMGESIHSEIEAREATKEFLQIANSIKKTKLHSTISLDLSHIGLAISKDLCLENLKQLCDLSEQHDIEVIISAEGVDRTDAVIDVYKTLSKDYENLAITMQAYLHRSKEDFRDLIEEKGRIRIVKGAFETPKGYAIPRGNELDQTYLEYVDQLLSKQHKCAIATHHDYIQQEAKKLIDQYKSDQNKYEFESLYGIQNEQLDTLKEEGYMTKVYFVYGKEWYLYLCNRIAEYPMNLFRALDDIVNN